MRPIPAAGRSRTKARWARRCSDGARAKKSRSRRRAACGPSRSRTSTGSAGALATRNTRTRVCARVLLFQQAGNIRRKSVVEKLGSVAKGRVVTRTGRRPTLFGPRRQFDRNALKEALRRQRARAVLQVDNADLHAQRLRFERSDQPWLGQDRLALRRQLRAQRLVVVGVAAHQHLGDSANVVLVEQPDLACGDLLRVAHADRLRNARAAFAEELARRRLNAERLVVQVVTENIRGHELPDWRLFTGSRKVGLLLDSSALCGHSLNMRG